MFIYPSHSGCSLNLEGVFLLGRGVPGDIVSVEPVIEQDSGPREAKRRA